ncbi:uncharacterized protein ACLA_047450 [Aspergillus clavatus NRRL 1]|uniref:SWR1-complex protein 3 domain-containing protein n=1 Tax=Aspergillus clavatus (strain ATCC 1007 / CBS 513.65 / DSM 816 / NCTC 3887 / NRRL 1 / QM 1276 / 107) TaxID=344612 RepID=A1CHC1_ASPCL|nr:uncharacterized protein ACLA_047450 [Aspergillus clavatus NRRL 1]EAW10276.1 hypothetical protein ACLA_047450 [Aspergillus clavatus NRRL 1]
MAEKRKLSTRDRREPSAKRRASEVAPQGSSKKKGSTPSVAPTPPPALPATPAPVEKPLPTKIKDGEALPTVSSPQPAELPDTEYQSIAESAVLLASLERSKKKWLSDGILERYYTKPKKSKREQIEGKNPPKESMVKVGSCNIAVGPHLFDAMLYTVKDPNAPPPIQYTPPQRPMVHYGHPNFQQYQSYPHPPSSQQSRQQSHHSPAHSASPQPGYHQGQHPPPQPARTSNQPPPPHHPPHPPYNPQSAQRPPPSQHTQPPKPPKPSPDPVIQMLATRAASDPELKALMRVVASSKASQEQLRAFQAHIDELNAIIRAREQQQQRQLQAQSQVQAGRQTPQTPHPPQQKPSQPPPSSQKPQQQHQQANQQHGHSLPQQGSTPQHRPQSQGQQHSMPRVEVQVPKPSPAFKLNSQHPGQNSPKQLQTPAAQKSAATPQLKQEPGVASTVQMPSTGVPGSNVVVVPPPASGPGSGPPQLSPSPAVRPTPNQPTSTQGSTPRSGGQYPPYQAQSPAIQSRPPPHGSSAPYYRPAPPPPPPARFAYKSVVFEFTSPLTPYGSSTSGHAGSGDRYLFPEYSILEWLPGGNTVLASFLLTRKVDPNTPFPIEIASAATTTRAKGKSAKSKKADKSNDKDKKAGDKAEEPGKDQENGQPQQEPTPADAGPKPSTSEPVKTSEDKGDQKGQPTETPSKVKLDSEKQPSKEKQEDAGKTNLKEYYQPVTLRIYSANPKFLEPLGRVVKPPEEVRKYMNEIMDRAERAPDGFLAMRLPRETKDDGHEPEEIRKSGTPAPAVMSGARGRALRGKAAEEDSEIENINTPAEEEEEEEELKDFYGPPTGLPPLRV